jgi:ABC-2 type transport system ATP-binding protein
MEEVQLLCNRVAIIDIGSLVALDTIKNLVAMLGGGVIQIGLNKVDDQILAELSALPSVKTAGLAPAVALAPVTAAGEGGASPSPISIVKIEATDSRQALVEVINYCNERDIPLVSLETLEPNLESVFLHLTGKKLRE